jgi:NADH-quinone oxidoreductase subunit G
MSDLITLTIDGVETSVPQGTLVADAAKQIGIEIPVFCHHPKLEPVGMCRMCLVEIGLPMRDRATGELMLEEDGRPKLNFGPGLRTSCTAVVSEGMVVRTKTEPVQHAQADVVEFLLTNHPLDCPICDKGGECPLQNLTMAHGKGETRVHYDDKLHMQKHVALGELIFLDRERCIQCARCIRFQEEIVDDPVIRFHNRGRKLEIVTMSDPGFDSYWSGNTTDICPVGALTSADFRFGARPWEMTTSASLCTHCPVGCNTTLSTRREAKAGGRAVIKRIMPRQNEAVNEIWMCDKGRFVHHFAEAPDRLTTPLVRRNGELVEATWDEALDLAAEKLGGLQTVAGLAGGRLSNEDLFLFQKLFRKGLKSGNIDLAQRTLAGGEVAAQVGLTSGSDLQQLGAGDAILVVAADLHEEAPVWWLRVKQAADRGAKVVLVNPFATRLDKHAAQVMRVLPGALLATVNQLVNMAKVETADSDNEIVAAAQMLGGAENLLIFYGSAGLTYAETDTLARMLGNLLTIQNGSSHAGKVNNGLVPVWPRSNTQGAWDVGLHPALLPGYKAAKEAGLDAAAIAAGVADGSVNGLLVAGADPVGDGLLADRGKLDFLAVAELFMTETAVLADVVFPAQSWAEREGTFTSGERRVQRYYPALPAVGQSRPDWQILAQLGARLGAGKAPVAASLAFKEVTRAVKQYKGIDYRSLAQVEKQWPAVGGDDLYYGGNAVENRSGLGQQWQAAAEKGDVAHFDVPAVAETKTDALQIIYKPALYTPGTLLDHTEMLNGRKAQPTLALHADDAAALAVADGDRVEVMVDGTAVQSRVHVNGSAPAGLGLLSGVKRWSETAVVTVDSGQ